MVSDRGRFGTYKTAPGTDTSRRFFILLGGQMDFQTLLAGLISGALTVPVVAWILNQFPEIEARRALAVAASFLLGTGAFLLSGWLGYTELPTDLKSWLEVLWPVWTAAFTASQMVLSAIRATSK